MWTEEDQIKVFVAGSEFTFPGLCRVSRTSRFPFLKQFEINSGSEMDVSFYYWHADSEWPPAEDDDILFNISMTTASRQETARFVKWWSMIANGREPWAPEFQQEIADFDRTVGDSQLVSSAD